jgi:hypothetical protein
MKRVDLSRLTPEQARKIIQVAGRSGIYQRVAGAGQERHESENTELLRLRFRHRRTR